MAAVSASLSIAYPITSTPSSSIKSGLAGASLHVLPPLVTKRTHRSLTVYAGGGKKIQTKEPFGPSGGAKFKDGLDASGRKSTGKGVYQFAKKYGANVDGYSPIYAPEEWSSSGDVYTGGTGGLTLWALTLGAILLGGALLVYNTSALAQ